MHVSELLPPVIFFTDAAFEEIGLHSARKEVSGGFTPESMVLRWQVDGSMQFIGQAEAFALLLARRVCKTLLMNRLVLFYIQ